MSPLTLVTVKPLMKVTYDPAGIFPVAVKDTVSPGDGGLHSYSPFPQPLPGQPLPGQPSRLTYTLGLPHSGSSHRQFLPSAARDGKAVKGRAMLEDGQLLMKEAASVYADVGSRGCVRLA